MSRRVYSEINLHLTWHTKHSVPMIAESIEPSLHGFLRDKVFETAGTLFHAVGGTANHVHLAVSIRPTIDLDDWIGKLKGASSHHVGKALQMAGGLRNRFIWDKRFKVGSELHLESESTPQNRQSF